MFAHQCRKHFLSRKRILAKWERGSGIQSRADLRKLLSERAGEAGAAAWKAIPPGALRQETRCRAPVAQARQAAMYFAHVVFEANLTRAGRIFGRDRTTARHACSQMEDLRDDPRVDRAFDALECALKSWVGAFTGEETP